MILSTEKAADSVLEAGIGLEEAAAGPSAAEAAAAAAAA